MGYDINRFVENSVDEEFVCNICHDVLEEPLMVSHCEHLYCSQCIRECVKVRGVCPQDRSRITINQLVEPPRIVNNLLNKLRIKCRTGSGSGGGGGQGCQEVLLLGELVAHHDKCAANTDNKVKCFCNQEMAINHFNTHKASCVEHQKNALKVAKSQLKTYSETYYDFAEQMANRVTKESEIKFLYKCLKQCLPSLPADYNNVEKCLLYISWKLLSHEMETEKDLLATIRYVKYGLRGLSPRFGQRLPQLLSFRGLKCIGFPISMRIHV
jgi:hypothetical protein